METTRKNIFITGITGSVGHYVFDLLANNQKYHLYLLVRDEKKLKRDLSKYNNITLIKSNLENAYKQKEILRQMDFAILIATTWGGFKEPWRQNVYATFRILRALDKDRIQKVVYFSTASILDRNHQPVEAIREIGTNYIRSKFLAHKIIQYNKLKSKIITVFPTWVYGGGKEYPFSHAASGLRGLKNSIKFFKYFTAAFNFHFIHCADIAKMTVYMLENPLEKNEYVLGNKPLSVGDFLKETAVYYGQKVPFQIKIPMKMIQALSKLQKTHSWDQYCMRYCNFVYDVLNCKKLGIPSDVDTVAGVLASLDK